MPDIVDDQVEELLREAEHRLRGASAAARPMQPAPMKDSARAAEPSVAVSKEELAVRRPQVKPTGRDVKKVSGPTSSPVTCFVVLSSGNSDENEPLAVL